MAVLHGHPEGASEEQLQRGVDWAREARVAATLLEMVLAERLKMRIPEEPGDPLFSNR